MTAHPVTHRCRACGGTHPREAMVMRGGRVSRLCRACAAAQERARYRATRAPALRVDPCPVCGVAQAAHWRCTKCGSRGHITGRSPRRAGLCLWCEADLTLGPGWELVQSEPKKKEVSA